MARRSLSEAFAISRLLRRVWLRPTLVRPRPLHKGAIAAMRADRSPTERAAWSPRGVPAGESALCDDSACGLVAGIVDGCPALAPLGSVRSSVCGLGDAT